MLPGLPLYFYCRVLLLLAILVLLRATAPSPSRQLAPSINLEFNNHHHPARRQHISGLHRQPTTLSHRVITLQNMPFCPSFPAGAPTQPTKPCAHNTPRRFGAPNWITGPNRGSAERLHMPFWPQGRMRKVAGPESAQQCMHTYRLWPRFPCSPVHPPSRLHIKSPPQVDHHAHT